jgi:hypothetical protein
MQKLAKLNDLVTSRNPRAPKADVSNAPHLMGDVYGEPYEEGDPEGAYGDIDDEAGYGDVSTSALDTFNTLIGDAYDDDEMGAPRKRSLVRKIAIGAGAAGAGALATKLIIDGIKKRKARRNAIQQNLALNARENTIANQVRARRMMGNIPRTAAMPFYQIVGATLNSYPLAPTEVFAADTLKYNFDRQSTDTPFEVEIVTGTFAGVTWTLTATGVVATRFYVAVVITIGISVLTANPGTIFSVVGTMPTINGSLVIAANPFSFTIRRGYYAKFMIFPWQLVTNKPLLALGAYNNANPITFNITGLPSNASVSMITPGSQHVWTIGMRNRLLK